MKTQTLFIILGILAVGVIVAVAVTSAPKNSTDDSAPAADMADDAQLLDEEGNSLDQETLEALEEEEMVSAPENETTEAAPAAPDFPVTGYNPEK